MTKVCVSEKQIINIYEFMSNYLDVEYKENGKLTHKSMEEYLMRKRLRKPSRVSFDTVGKESLLTGEYIVVKDDASKILIYKNPRESLDMLLIELNSTKNIEIRKKRRKDNLLSMNLIDTNIGVLDINDIEQPTYKIEKENRQRQFVKSNNTYYRKKNY